MIARLKQLVKSRLPGLAERYEKTRSALRTVGNIFYDGRRFIANSSAARVPRDRDHAHRHAVITKYYHIIEKALALPEPRPGFGAFAVAKLCKEVSRAIAVGDRSPPVLRALEAIAAYNEFSRRCGVDPHSTATSLLIEALECGIEVTANATLTRTRADIVRSTSFDLAAFFCSRHSVRVFTGEPIARTSIEAAIRVAMTAPSVCNRRSSRVVVLTDPAEMRGALSYQNGNRGFGDRAGAVFIVTSDVRNFVDSGERYQCWIDGGMFSMNLLLGLHGQGLGACALNWSADASQDKALRSFANIADWEVVIMMIAAGQLPETFQVARSPAPAISEITRFGLKH